MNSIYQSIWNEKTGTFVAVSENTRRGGKKTSSSRTAAGAGVRFALQTIAACVMLSLGAQAWSAPVGGAVSAGSANIASGAGVTTITQASQNAAINWQSFNIAQGETVRFAQPNSSSVALNRVLGSDPSSILGNLSANGKVFLINPNGILFGKTASVNVGGLVASTMNISDTDFMAGNYKFTGAGNGAVVNQGAISADGGYVALLGANVSNDGVISARLGTVALAAGQAATLDVAGDGLLNVTIDQGALDALASNGGLIQADGGQVLMTAQAAGQLLGTRVSNSGVIEARTLENHNGTIRLLGDMQGGTVSVGGTLDASGMGAGQTGGSVTATGHHVGLFGANINASGDAGGGTVLIGGDYQGKNPSVQNAAATYMSADSVIAADAITDGNGGKVVLWADGSTRASGSITARGGAQGGNGGMVETSGHWLDVKGVRVNAGAPNGEGGMWLLDPANVTIGAGNLNGSFTGNVFSPDSGVATANVDAGAIQTSLNAGNDVTITTANDGVSGAGLGDITVSSALTWTTGKTLTLNAEHDVIVNGALTASTQNAKIVLTAQNDIKVNAALVASELNTQILLTAGRDVTATAAVTATGLGAVIDMGAGRDVSVVAVTANGGGAVNSINLHANNDVIVNNDIRAAGGNVMLRADSDGSGPGVTAGTVRFAGPGRVFASTTTAIRFNPDGYANTAAEIAAYAPKVTAVTLDAKAWVFAQGVDKVYDGLTTATLQFKDPLGDNPNVGNTVTLDGGSATFNTEDVGDAKPITFNGYTVGGGDLARFALFSLVGVAPGDGTTTARITPAPLTITANDATKTYGGTLAFSGTEYTNTATKNSETVGNVTLVSAGAIATAPVATYAITPSDASSNGAFAPSNYTITYVNGALAVTPAPLTLKANDATKVYGQTFAPLSTAFTTPVGPVNGETVTGVTETSAGTAPTASVAGSTYPIVITPGSATGTFTASNYTITYLDGALTVTPAPLTLKANDATKVFGQTFAPLSTAFTTPVAPVNGETVTGVTETSAGAAPTASVAGSTYPIVITPGSATGTFTASNYDISYATGNLTVTPPSGSTPPGSTPPGSTPPIETLPVETLPVETLPIVDKAGETLTPTATTPDMTPLLPTGLTIVQADSPLSQPALVFALNSEEPTQQPAVALAPPPAVALAPQPAPAVYVAPNYPRKPDRN